MVEDVVCVCGEVPESAVLDAIASGAQTVEEIAALTGACRNCGDCRCDLEELLTLDRI